MKTFTDNQGQQWTLVLTLSKVRKLREQLGLDLLNPQHYLQVLNSLTDQLAFCFLLVEQQAKTMEVSVDDFEERIYGEGIAAEVSIAFLGETEVFFRKLGQTAMGKLARKSIEMRGTATEHLDQMLESGEFDSVLNQAAEEMQKQMQPVDGNG